MATKELCREWNAARIDDGHAYSEETYAAASIQHLTFQLTLVFIPLPQSLLSSCFLLLDNVIFTV